MEEEEEEEEQEETNLLESLFPSSPLCQKRARERERDVAEYNYCSQYFAMINRTSSAGINCRAGGRARKFPVGIFFFMGTSHILSSSSSSFLPSVDCD